MSNSNVIVNNPKGGTMMISVEIIKNDYICEGSSAEELSSKYSIPLEVVKTIISDNKLQDLRAAHIKHGLAKLQNVQLGQAEKLMDMETQFKKMRLVQLEKILSDYLAYYSRHGHFYKLHPVTNEILRDTDGIAMQIRIPNVSKEINDLKESVSLSQGLKNLLGQIDDLINKPKDPNLLDANVIDMEQYGSLFQKKKSED